MNLRKHSVLLVVLTVSLVGTVIATSGCKRLSNRMSEEEKQEVAETLAGTWTIDTNSMELSEDASIKVNPNRTEEGGTRTLRAEPGSLKPPASEEEAARVNSNLVVGQMMGYEITFVFGQEGDFEMRIGPETYEGTWEIPQQDGDSYVFVTRFPMSGILGDDEVEGIDKSATKQLVERLYIIDDTTIEIEDDQGNRYRMTKAENDSATE
jgi:hypothetical protein